METKEQKKLRYLLKMEASTPVVSYKGTVYEVIRWQLPNGEIHRDLGPAIESIDGTRYWYQYGERHRDDGPAVTFEADKDFNQYWLEGKKLTKEKFEKWKLKNKNK